MMPDRHASPEDSVLLNKNEFDQDALHRAILESSVDYAIISTDLDGFVTSWNHGARNVLGWDRDEVIGESATVIFTPEDVACNVPQTEMRRSVEMGRAEDERWHIRKDRSRFWGNGLMMPLRCEAGKHIGFLKILRDRTDQRQIQDNLLDSEARTRLAIEAAEVGIWETDLDLKQLKWDARTRELFGIPENDVLDHQKSFVDSIHPADRDRVQLEVLQALRSDNREAIDVEFRTVSHSNEERWLHAKGRVIENRNIHRFMGTVRDISAQKAAEAHQKLLTGELQHRIRNTLTMVQAIVNQSLREAETPKDASKAINERLLTLGKAHDLLTRSSWRAAPVTDIVSGAVDVHRAGPNRIRIDGPVVMLDARQALNLTLVLHELCTNAVKYGALSNDAGHVEITWAITEGSSENEFSFTWQECNGPVVIPPRKKGFGSRLIENSLRSEIRAVTQLEFDPAGVRWTLQLPLPK